MHIRPEHAENEARIWIWFCAPVVSAGISFEIPSLFGFASYLLITCTSLFRDYINHQYKPQRRYYENINAMCADFINSGGLSESWSDCSAGEERCPEREGDKYEKR